MGREHVGYGGNPSRADLALLNRLAKHSRDLEQIDRISRRLGLYRAKWERADYRERTIARALSGKSPGPAWSTPTVDGPVSPVSAASGMLERPMSCLMGIHLVPACSWASYSE